MKRVLLVVHIVLAGLGAVSAGEEDSQALRAKYIKNSLPPAGRSNYVAMIRIVDHPEPVSKALTDVLESPQSVPIVKKYLANYPVSPVDSSVVKQSKTIAAVLCFMQTGDFDPVRGVFQMLSDDEVREACSFMIECPVFSPELMDFLAERMFLRIAKYKYCEWRNVKPDFPWTGISEVYGMVRHLTCSQAWNSKDAQRLRVLFAEAPFWMKRAWWFDYTDPKQLEEYLEHGIRGSGADELFLKNFAHFAEGSDGIILPLLSDNEKLMYGKIIAERDKKLRGASPEGNK